MNVLSTSDCSCSETDCCTIRCHCLRCEMGVVPDIDSDKSEQLPTYPPLQWACSHVIYMFN